MKIRGKTTGNLMTVILISLIICLSSGMVWASPVAGIRSALGMGNHPIPSSHVEWMRGAIQQDYVLGDRETAEWINKLLEGSRSGEFTDLETVNEVFEILLEKMMEEVGGDHSQKLNKIAVRLAYGSAGLPPESAKAFIRQADSRIDLGDFSFVANGRLDLGSIGIMPAKPYFVMTFDSIMESSGRNFAKVVKDIKSVAHKSIDDGHAGFSMTDYKAAFFSYMDGLDPSDYDKAIKLHNSLFAPNFDALTSSTYRARGEAYVSGGRLIGSFSPDDINRQFARKRLEIFSNPYFEAHWISTGRVPGTDLVYKVLDDISKGHIGEFTKESVLKLWNTVDRVGNPDMTQAFRKAVENSIKTFLRSPNYLGRQFVHSLIEATKESEDLHKLLNEVQKDLIGFYQRG